MVLRLKKSCPRTRQNVTPDSEVFTWPLTYPAATLDPSKATLTVRKYRTDQPTLIPATEWQYLKVTTIGLLPAGKTAFARGMIYQFVYPATDPKVVGIGFPAVRDVVSFLRHAGADAQGTPIHWRTRYSGRSPPGYHSPGVSIGRICTTDLTRTSKDVRYSTA